MELDMDEKAIRSLAKEIAKGVNSEQDLSDFSKLLRKITVETALEAELDERLGYEKHAPEGRSSGNSRNGKSSKRLKGDHGEVEIETPRDRNGTFEPQLIGKGQTRLTGMDDQILFLYAKGMGTREIVSTFKEMYDADVSPTLTSKVTDRVIERVIEWQHRPLDALYPIVYLDCIVLKVRHNQCVINQSLYRALGLNLDGRKELLGLWMGQTEGANFWLSVLSELKSRGVKDILIARVDGLKGFPDAIAAEYPETKIQLCLVHMVRNSLRFVPWKTYKAVTADLKRIYQSATEVEALAALDAFAETWDSQYPQISKSCDRHGWRKLNS